MPTITLLPHGDSYTHGTPYREGRAWYRTDTFHCPEYPDIDGAVDQLSAAGPWDDSPLSRETHPTCPCCRKGDPHTTARHKDLVMLSAQDRSEGTGDAARQALMPPNTTEEPCLHNLMLSWQNATIHEFVCAKCGAKKFFFV